MSRMQQGSAEVAWVSQLIRQARARLGFDHRWAADVLGVTAGYLLMVETGMTEPSVAFCRRVITALNMPEAEATELLAAVGAVEERERTWTHA